MLLVYLIWMLGVKSMNGLEFEKLPDRIIVSQGENISFIEGEWTLLLTIHEDGVRHRLATHVELVRQSQELWNDVIGKQAIGEFFTKQRKALMRAKVDLVVGAEQELQYNVTLDRNRRGVLDFVGTRLQWAFGTATEAQVDQLQQAVDTARASQKAIVHNVRELITVVNQTQAEGKDTRRKLSVLSQAYDRFVKNNRNRWSHYGHGTKLLMMEVCLFVGV